MKMTQGLYQSTIDKIDDIDSLKFAILNICRAYEEQHPKKSGFFTVKNRHRNHAVARRIERKVSTLKLVPVDYIEQAEDSFPLLYDVYLSSGDGSLHRCISMAIETYFEQKPEMKEAFEQFRLVKAFDAMGF